MITRVLITTGKHPWNEELQVNFNEVLGKHYGTEVGRVGNQRQISSSWQFCSELAVVHL